MTYRFLLARVLLIAGLTLPALIVHAGEYSLPREGEGLVVSVATLTGYKPYCFEIDGAESLAEEILPPGSDSVQIQGFSWDIVRESFHEMGYTIRLVVVPWTRGMLYLKQGKVDIIFPTAVTDERLKTLIYSREKVNSAEYLIYVPASCDCPWHGLQGLRGKRIAVIRGWSYGKEWEEESEIRKEALDDILQCFRMLDRGRVYGVAGYDVVFDYVLAQEGIAHQYRKLPSFGRNDEYLAALGSKPENRRILDDFDEGKRRIVETGVYEAIEDKWQI